MRYTCAERKTQQTKRTGKIKSSNARFSRRAVFRVWQFLYFLFYGRKVHPFTISFSLSFARFDIRRFFFSTSGPKAPSLPCQPIFLFHFIRDNASTVYKREIKLTRSKSTANGSCSHWTEQTRLFRAFSKFFYPLAYFLLVRDVVRFYERKKKLAPVKNKREFCLNSCRLTLKSPWRS